MTQRAGRGQAPTARPLGWRRSGLGEPGEVIGEVAAELSVTRDNPDADLFVRLCDVDPRGRSRNVCDGIVRLTAADPLTGIVRVSPSALLLPVASVLPVAPAAPAAGR